MSNMIPDDGQYYIIPTFLMQPSPGVGADIDNPPGRPGAGLPVVFNGNEQVWTITRGEDGSYYLDLQGWKSVDYKDQVFVNPSIATGQQWYIEPKEAGCLITLPNSVMCWTLPNIEDKAPVVLQRAEEPFPNQLWFFKRVE